MENGKETRSSQYKLVDNIVAVPITSRPPGPPAVAGVFFKKYKTFGPGTLHVPSVVAFTSIAAIVNTDFCSLFPSLLFTPFSMPPYFDPTKRNM